MKSKRKASPRRGKASASKSKAKKTGRRKPIMRHSKEG